MCTVLQYSLQYISCRWSTYIRKHKTSPVLEKPTLLWHQNVNSHNHPLGQWSLYMYASADVFWAYTGFRIHSFERSLHCKQSHQSKCFKNTDCIDINLPFSGPGPAALGPRAEVQLDPKPNAHANNTCANPKALWTLYGVFIDLLFWVLPKSQKKGYSNFYYQN